MIQEILDIRNYIFWYIRREAANRGVLQKKVFLKIFPKFTWKYLYQSLFFSKVTGLHLLLLLLLLVKLQALAFSLCSCEFCEIFTNISFTEQFRATL